MRDRGKRAQAMPLPTEPMITPMPYTDRAQAAARADTPNCGVCNWEKRWVWIRAM